MKKFRAWHWMVTGVAALGMAVSLGTGSQSAWAQASHPLLGGSWGLVRSAKGIPLEGIGVQVIAPQTGIRTTVYTNEDGRYEFPKLEAGTYTLRVARPREYRPYQRDSVQITGAQ
ncbi:MAG: carboxypeptidase-like regulatory domain-containing protein, partial [Terriglobia bacterium]